MNFIITTNLKINDTVMVRNEYQVIIIKNSEL